MRSVSTLKVIVIVLSILCGSRVDAAKPVKSKPAICRIIVSSLALTLGVGLFTTPLWSLRLEDHLAARAEAKKLAATKQALNTAMSVQTAYSTLTELRLSRHLNIEIPTRIYELGTPAEWLGVLSTAPATYLESFSLTNGHCNVMFQIGKNPSIFVESIRLSGEIAQGLLRFNHWKSISEKDRVGFQGLLTMLQFFTEKEMGEALHRQKDQPTLKPEERAWFNQLAALNLGASGEAEQFKGLKAAIEALPSSGK